MAKLVSEGPAGTTALLAPQASQRVIAMESEDSVLSFFDVSIEEIHQFQQAIDAWQSSESECSLIAPSSFTGGTIFSHFYLFSG